MNALALLQSPEGWPLWVIIILAALCFLFAAYGAIKWDRGGKVKLTESAGPGGPTDAWREEQERLMREGRSIVGYNPPKWEAAPRRGRRG